MINREIKNTTDGSKTLYVNALNESYHSTNGALQEAFHVFIENGLKQLDIYEINILEMGFGTGLNLLVTLDEYLKTDKYHKINYFAVEKYPVTFPEIEALDYAALFENEEIRGLNTQIHAAIWNEPVSFSKNFTVTKLNADFFDLKTIEIPPVDLVYFDCFGARVQPELWEMPLLKIVAEKIRPGGLFTTYSSKGSLRRDLQQLGFSVEKKPGPPGKREMINAFKK